MKNGGSLGGYPDPKRNPSKDSGAPPKVMGGVHTPRVGLWLHRPWEANANKYKGVVP